MLSSESKTKRSPDNVSLTTAPRGREVSGDLGPPSYRRGNVLVKWCQLPPSWSSGWNQNSWSQDSSPVASSNSWQHRRPQRKSDPALAPFQPCPTPLGARPTLGPHTAAAHTVTAISKSRNLSLCASPPPLETALVSAGPVERPKVMQLALSLRPSCLTLGVTLCF